MVPSKYIPLWSLFVKEVMRFFKVGMQTILGPAISSLLFLAVFHLALGRSIEMINGVSLAKTAKPTPIAIPANRLTFSVIKLDKIIFFSRN